MKTRKPYYVGIDYSMTSPAMTVCYSKEFDPKKCEFFFLTKEKSKLRNKKPFFAPDLLMDEFSCNEERFLRIAMFFESVIVPPAKPIITIEGYSFASKGQVFNIGELTGILKNRLYQANLQFDVVSPGTVKKFATGKGNALKPDMMKAFKEDTGIDLELEFDVSQRKNKSPAADIADSYFICKLGAQENTTTP